jgi:hypothetical protein
MRGRRSPSEEVEIGHIPWLWVKGHPALLMVCFPHFASRQVIPPDFKML